MPISMAVTCRVCNQLRFLLLYLDFVIRVLTRLHIIAPIFAVVALSILSSLTHAAVNFKVSQNGSYGVIVDERTWLSSAPTTLHVDGKQFSTADGTLGLKGCAKSTGHDAFGEFNRVTFSYNAGLLNFSNSIYMYNEPGSKYQMNIFTQDYPTELHNTSVGNKQGVISQFPAYKILPIRWGVGVLAYGDLFSGYVRQTITSWKPGMGALPGGLSSGPIALFDKQDNVIIISAFNHFTANSYVHDNKRNTIGWGIMGNVEQVPAGYSMQTVVFYSDAGINQAMEDWGAMLRMYYGRTSDAMETDPTINYLGYYTDNGAYYYHLTEKGKNYEQTLFDVYNDSIAKNIPYKYIQYDDWWYPVEKTKTNYGAVLKWEPLPDVFPHGLQYLYDVMKLPVIAHNRYWSYKTPYAKANNGSWDFLIDNDSGFALPLEEKFWDWLFYKAKEWGLVNYEQDFLCTQMEQIAALTSDVTLAETWLQQMGNAAARYNLKIQYCMALPREIMAALEINAVSQARASRDYINDGQWQIGVTSLFLHAMRIAPSKDNFWTTSVQPGNPWGRVEVSPVREAVVAILSTGPVGVSDKLGLTNTNITQRLCRDDGLLLKPGRPATAINAQFMQRAFGGSLGPDGEVYSTVYKLGSVLTVGVIFASEMKQNYKLTSAQAGFDKVVEWMAYAMDDVTTLPQEFSQSPVMLGRGGINATDVYYVSPRLKLKGMTDFVLMGELSKYVPLSPQRIVSLTYTDNEISAVIVGAAKEVVTMYYSANGHVQSVMCELGTAAEATLFISGEQQTCASS